MCGVFMARWVLQALGQVNSGREDYGDNMKELVHYDGV